MSPRKRLLPLLVGVILVGAGCGVQTQDEAQSLPVDSLPGVPSPTPTPSATSSSVYFVSGRGLEEVAGVQNDNTARGVLRALRAGPPLERQTDLRTLINDPLTGEPMLRVSSATPEGSVTLAISDAFTLLPANDQVLLVGQVVTSLDDVGFTSVMVVDQTGAPVQLVHPDGRVLEGPATASEYKSLITAA